MVETFPTQRHLIGKVALAVGAAALVGLIVWSATHPDLPQFRGKAMAGRLACFPLAALLVLAGWWLASRRRGRRLAFPYEAAALVTWPFVIDLAGNATRQPADLEQRTFGLYASLEYFDDAVHAVNPVLFVCAITALLDRTGVPRWASWVMAFGIGCAGHILWEIIEYLLLEGIGAVELDLSLRDTLSDQAWGLLGAAVGASLAMLLPPRAPETRLTDTERGAAASA